MRIEVSRSGGFAGIVRRAEVDTDGREDAEEWVRLADRARPLPEGPGAGRSGGPGAVRDGFTWSIRVDEQHAVLPDSRLDGALRDLAERALAESRRSPREA